MNFTIFGATGKVGSRVIAEAVAQGHAVTAVARKTDRPDSLPNAVDFRTGDIGNIDDVISLKGNTERCKGILFRGSSKGVVESMGKPDN